MTEAIVLAAGMGSRLAGVTALPKWLLPIRDMSPTCPAEAQLRALDGAGIDVVHVVVGSTVEPIQEAVDRWRGDLTVRLVHNDHSTTRNNWYSLLVGFDSLERPLKSDVVVLNSDLYASVGWIETSIRRCLTTTTAAAMVVDRARGHTQEAMKVSLHDDGGIDRVGKVGIDHPEGEYVGVSRWNPSAARGLANHLRRFIDTPEHADNWYEHAIDDHLRGDGDYGLVAAPDSSWVEIDDESDLAAARALEG